MIEYQLSFSVFEFSVVCLSGIEERRCRLSLSVIILKVVLRVVPLRIIKDKILIHVCAEHVLKARRLHRFAGSSDPPIPGAFLGLATKRKSWINLFLIYDQRLVNGFYH